MESGDFWSCQVVIAAEQHVWEGCFCLRIGLNEHLFGDSKEVDTLPQLTSVSCLILFHCVGADKFRNMRILFPEDYSWDFSHSSCSLTMITQHLREILNCDVGNSRCFLFWLYSDGSNHWLVIRDHCWN